METCRQVKVRNKERERGEIKPDEINPHIMLALWWSGSAPLSSRRACFTLEMKCECSYVFP